MQYFDNLSDNLKGVVILTFAAAMFSIMIALVKYAGEGLPVVQIVFLRQLGMFIIMSPTILTDFPASIITKRPGLQVLRVCLALVALFGGFTAVVNMPLADATALGFAKSFFVTLFAIIILREYVGPYRWGAIFVGFIGVAVMVQPGTTGYSIYGIYALMAAAAAGLVMVIIRLLSKTESSTSIMGFQVFGIGIVTLFPAIALWQQPTIKEWMLLVGISCASYLAQRANIYAYKHGEASLLASLDYVRLLFATVIGFFVFGHLPAASTWIGAGIIVAAAVFTVYRESRRKQMLTRAPEARSFNNS